MPDDELKKRNKTAVALEYVPGEEAPKILATGKGLLAEKIIEKAKEAAVPVHKDTRLANTLANLEVGDYIPPELYQAVAEVLLFVENMDKLREKVGR
ncbi:MAG: EscU/YscU/HrcU family type III secretion system export apparatus switch protein [Lachnospiraceae bacterium]|nr:EscU/YscU/HrcU family type III secretion system export apparatus switch protein [Lachnospiraceae bacterium]MBP5184613.1 EscU/YscU/HrcU family type III secretion system export apparatus switch protein [Lachnospiraceae bacterium]